MTRDKRLYRTGDMVRMKVTEILNISEESIPRRKDKEDIVLNLSEIEGALLKHDKAK